MNSSHNIISLSTVQKIALCLSGAWKVEQQSTSESVFRANMIREDGFTIHVYSGGYGNEDKVKFSFTRPKNHRQEYVSLWDNHTQVSDPSIGCSASKSFDKLTNDIINRLMPDAEGIFIRVRNIIKEQKESYDKKNKNIEDICHAVGIKPDRGHDQEYRTHYSIPTIDQTINTINIHYNGTIELKLNHLSAEKAAAIIQFVKSL